MAFHGCICDECEQLYGHVGLTRSGKQVVYGKCQHGQASIRHIEDVLEAQRRIRDRGDEVNSDIIWDELGVM